MFVLGHVGLTVAAVRAVKRDADLRAPILLAILPDIIDKPTAFCFPALVYANTRNVGHSLAGALAVLAVLAALRRRWGSAPLLWACYLGHFVLDLLWTDGNRAILLWPLLGHFPRPVHGTYTMKLLAYNVAGEAAGLLLLLSLARRQRLSAKASWRAFLGTGRLSG